MVGVAVNVTEVPAHIWFDEADKLTEAITGESTTIIILFDVAGLPVAQVAFDVITTLISPLTKIADV